MEKSRIQGKRPVIKFPKKSPGNPVSGKLSIKDRVNLIIMKLVHSEYLELVDFEAFMKWRYSTYGRATTKKRITHEELAIYHNHRQQAAVVDEVLSELSVQLLVAMVKKKGFFPEQAGQKIKLRTLLAVLVRGIADEFRISQDAIIERIRIPFGIKAKASNGIKQPGKSTRKIYELEAKSIISEFSSALNHLREERLKGDRSYRKLLHAARTEKMFKELPEMYARITALLYRS